MSKKWIKTFDLLIIQIKKNRKKKIIKRKKGLSLKKERR